MGVTKENDLLSLNFPCNLFNINVQKIINMSDKLVFESFVGKSAI